MTFEFGSGNLFIQPATGNTTNTTPYELATLQEVTVDMDQSTKPLYGKLRSPVAIAPTEMKSTIKAKFARFNASVFNYFWGGVVTAGSQKTMALNSAGVPGEFATPAAGTFTVAQSAAFYTDLGVYDSVTGLYMVKVPSAPALGQYSQSGGVYTVNASDTNLKYVYYVYSLGTTVGDYINIPNLPMGSNPQFSMFLFNNQWQGTTNQMLLQLYLCGSNKLSMGYKNTDWMIPDFEAYYMDPGTGFIGEMNITNVG